MPRSAAIFGATGVVGSACLRVLVADTAYDRVVAIGRTPPRDADPKVRALVHSLDAISALGPDDTGPLDDVFCALGTTQAKAGSPAAFTAVDRDAVVAACAFAARTGARHFLMVSSVGASASSSSLYLRTKGEAEAGCTAFADRLRLTVFRPSLLLASRPEFRIAEELGAPVLRLLSPIMAGTPFAKYRPIAAETVARAMVAAARTDPARTGVAVLEHDEIQRLAELKPADLPAA